jgi:hypothetical protein
MVESFLALISSLFTLGIMVFKEYLARSAAARKEQEKYQLTVDEFEVIVNACLLMLRLQAREDSSKAKTVEDQVDGSLKDREKP